MELQLVGLEGFRKFDTKTELKTNGKLVALLGPNEAGKTSLLRAISQIGNHEPIPDFDLTRSQQIDEKQYIISATFKLSEDDLAAAKITDSTWFTIHKTKNGNWFYSFRPDIPPRDTSARSRLLKQLERIKGNNKIWGRVVNDHPDVVDQLDGAFQILASKNETLEDNQLEELEQLGEALTQASSSDDPQYLRQFPDAAAELIHLEKLPTPKAFAYAAIKSRLPKILFFSNDDRLLQGTYQVEELSDSVPSALENLARVAGIDIRAFIQAINANDAPEIAKFKSKANDELKRRFEETWSQSGVHVAFDVLNKEIQVLVREENYTFTRLAERSDGLRQFVALQAFTTRERADDPILLIDEAEMRLHYDAQADLIQMLSKQNVSSKIIYTTHSAGCLPEDLGNGVRLVEQRQKPDGSTSSSIRNQFWNRSQGGIEPLLFGMGAATLAFFPIRRALLTEGESDMLLLPSMFREVFGEVSLGFQVVPGLSKTSGINLPILARNGKGVAFAVDDDGGGRDLIKKISTAGFAQDSIFSIAMSPRVDCQIEDFINPKHLGPAISAAFAELEIKGQDIPASGLRKSGRIDQIQKAYKLRKSSDVPKTLIAYHVLDRVLMHPDIPVVDPRRKKDFMKFAMDVRNFMNSLNISA